MTLKPPDHEFLSNGKESHQPIEIQMPWIHHQDVQGRDSQVPKNKQNHEHRITGGKDKDNRETKEKSSVIVVKNQDI
jgi:hypothetical protein